MAIEVKDYDNYENYLEHQKEKTGEPSRRKRLTAAFEQRKEYFNIRFVSMLSRIIDLKEFKDSKVVCLGARMGEEVAALRDLGFNNAIGTDLIPREPYVIVEDFHNLSFEPETVGIFYTNSLDHSCKPEQMLKEASRCLMSGGYFIIEFFPGHMGKYESCKIDSVEDIKTIMPKDMKLVSNTIITEILTNPGIELIFEKE